MLREEQAEEQRESKDGDGVFVLEAEAGDNAKREPKFWILRVNHAQECVSAAGPKERL